MTISEVSKLTNLSADTLRYYEKIKLVDNIKRTSGGKRDYSKQNLDHLNFVNCMKKAGCSLEVIKEYMDLYAKGKKTVDQRVELLEYQKSILVQKVEELNESIDYLDYKIDHTKKQK